jgi:hypothetical protein
VSSRFLVGLGGWLLGAVTATTGSMIAVGELANGLFGPQTQQVAGITSSADLDAGGSSAIPAPAPTASASPSATPAGAPVTPVVSQSPRANSAAPPSAPPTLLTTADGSVLASCQPGGAYLVYWSPAQGFSADDVVRGPAQVASVTFSSQSGGVVMHVSCPAGTPVAHLFWLTPGPSASPSDE